jgi:uncharacterized protein YbjT (DUF2867 family)
MHTHESDQESGRVGAARPRIQERGIQTMEERKERKTVLVVGATGQQGGAVARHVLKKAFGVQALVRDPQKPRARALTESGIELVQGDLNDHESLERVLDGTYGVFSVQNYFQAGYDGEIRQGTAIADLAKKVGVEHFVYSSVGSAYRDTRISHFETKRKIEEHIRKLDLPYAILRPVFFMHNWEGMRERIFEGVFEGPLDPGKPLQQLAVDDLGAFAAMAFADPERWIGREVDIAGDEMTMPEMARIFGQITGREVRYVQIPWDQFRRTAGDEVTRMYEWFDEEGYEADISALHKEYPGLTTFEQYLRQSGWSEA